MKIKMKAQSMTQYGLLEPGQELTDEDGKYPTAFLNHLVDACNAADRIDYETKVDDDYEAKKKPLSAPSSRPDRVSRKKTSTSHKKPAR